MESRSLETSLRRRLVVLVGTALLAVAGAAYAITASTLEMGADESARRRAQAALSMLAAERAEGDTPEAAARETLLAADADGVCVMLRQDALESRGALEVPPALAGLQPDTCLSATGKNGEIWRGCAARAGATRAIVGIPTGWQQTALRRVGTWLLLIVLGAVLATALATRLAVRGLLRSLRTLALWSRAVSDADDLPPPPRDATVTEVEQLAASFDALVRRLIDALHRERASSAHIAHELRTSLTAMRGEVETMGPTNDGIATRLLADVDRMARVVDAILLLSRPRVVLKPVSLVNLADLVREVASPATPVDAPDEALVHADAHLVELALRNLLENAEKYSGHAATKVQVSRDEDAVRIAVLDDGPGLPEASRAKMFDRYWRAVADGDGSGLGLALVRAVAESHGGRAEVRPSPAGQGLEVSMTFRSIVNWHD
jgi:signal transduction histidine kinase